MSWLLVTHDFPPGYTGGIASWAEDLAAALHASGEEVSVLARATADAREADALRPYPVRRMAGRSWARWGAWWVALAGAPRALRGGLRVIFSTWPLASALGPIVRAAGGSVGVAFHGSDLTRLAAPTPAFQRAVGSANALLPVSRFLAGELERLGVRERVRVLPMPLILPDSLAPRGPGLLCVARLTPLKGVDRAIRLASALGLPLEVVGDGPERARLEAEARGADVRWSGRLERAGIAALPAAAAVLLPRPDRDGTGAEGLGLTLIEAAARGLPVIGCRTGGVPEAVGPGLVLEDPDELSPATLAAVRALLADPEAGQKARAWAREQHGPRAALGVLFSAFEGPSSSPA